MNPLLTQQDTETLLADHLPLISQCVTDGVDLFNERFGATAPMSPRSKASLIHDCTEESARVIFAGDPEIQFFSPGDLMVISVKDLALVRFRKFGDGFSFSCNSTQQTLDWEGQMPLDGLPVVTNLVAGYRLDETGRAIDRMAVVCSLNNRRMWHIELASGGVVVQMPRTLEQDAATFAVRSNLAEDAQGVDEG